MKSIVIHGHFYQPPRENPWTLNVEREASAQPFHDWNERIFRECYRANTYARVFDDQGLVESIINNFEYLSFNLGPTLLNWMCREHPITYAHIIGADHVSKARLGFGNAIAQGYNHMILPLANKRDCLTQIRWSKADFAYRFSRETEGFWLPETAANHGTLDALIDENIQFTILSPYQAERVRKIGEETWQDASGGKVDASMAYLYRHSDGSNRSLAVFFYDGLRSKAIAFDGALNSSSAFLDNLTANESGEGDLVSVATDGESYGHHTRFGDRTLAHAVAYEAKRRGLKISNYAAYLAEHPPTHEVSISHGPDGLGSSWSCAHGVGRWYRNCSCHAGGPEGWTQAWRQPLRLALDYLRDAGALRFEEAGSRFFKDPWAARDAYVAVILDRGEEERLMSEQLKRPLTRSQRVDALTLLEMQHHAMLMYTSCGWFFSDISGIESQQILKYAGRMIDDLQELGFENLRDGFLERLAEAESNYPEYGNGADVYLREVEQARITPQRVAAHIAMSSLVTQSEAQDELAGYNYERSAFRTKTHGHYKLCTGQVRLVCTTTGRQHSSVVAALHLGGIDFYCALRPFRNQGSFEESANRVWEAFLGASLPKLLRVLTQSFGPTEFALEHLLPGGQEKVSEAILRAVLERFSQQYAALYGDHQRTLDKLQSAGFHVPAELRAAAEFTLGRTLEAEIARQGASTDPRAYDRAVEIARAIHERGYRVDHSQSSLAFSRMITHAVHTAVSVPASRNIETVERLIHLTGELGLPVELSQAQEVVYARGVKLPESLTRSLKLSPKAFWSMEQKRMGEPQTSEISAEPVSEDAVELGWRDGVEAQTLEGAGGFAFRRVQRDGPLTGAGD